MMNIANQLTVLRIILTFVCVWLILMNSFFSLVAAFLVFIIASITDFLDGFFARRQATVTDLGKILDPIADKILVLGVFAAFIELNVVNAWMVIAIVMREFIITGIRFLGLGKGVVLEAKVLGKHKTVSQIAGIIIIFIALIAAKKIPNAAWVNLTFDKIIPALMCYIVFITVFSGLHYLWQNRKLISTF
jgi:CDP-diacylglycerol--glycerol-3-phosphate 3-phosphatidyltransferase